MDNPEIEVGMKATESYLIHRYVYTITRVSSSNKTFWMTDDTGTVVIKVLKNKNGEWRTSPGNHIVYPGTDNPYLQRYDKPEMYL